MCSTITRLSLAAALCWAVSGHANGFEHECEADVGAFSFEHEKSVLCDFGWTSPSVHTTAEKVVVRWKGECKNPDADDDETPEDTNPQMTLEIDDDHQWSHGLEFTHVTDDSHASATEPEYSLPGPLVVLAEQWKCDFKMKYVVYMRVSGFKHTGQGMTSLSYDNQCSSSC